MGTSFKVGAATTKAQSQESTVQKKPVKKKEQTKPQTLITYAMNLLEAEEAASSSMMSVSRKKLDCLTKGRILLQFMNHRAKPHKNRHFQTEKARAIKRENDKLMLYKRMQEQIQKVRPVVTEEGTENDLMGGNSTVRDRREHTGQSLMEISGQDSFRGPPSPRRARESKTTSYSKGPQRHSNSNVKYDRHKAAREVVVRVESHVSKQNIASSSSKRRQNNNFMSSSLEVKNLSVRNSSTLESHDEPYSPLKIVENQSSQLQSKKQTPRHASFNLSFKDEQFQNNLDGQSIEDFHIVDSRRERFMSDDKGTHEQTNSSVDRTIQKTESFAASQTSEIEMLKDQAAADKNRPRLMSQSCSKRTNVQARKVGNVYSLCNFENSAQSSKMKRGGKAGAAFGRGGLLAFHGHKNSKSLNFTAKTRNNMISKMTGPEKQILSSCNSSLKGGADTLNLANTFDSRQQRPQTQSRDPSKITYECIRPSHIKQGAKQFVLPLLPPKLESCKEFQHNGSYGGKSAQDQGHINQVRQIINQSTNFMNTSAQDRRLYKQPEVKVQKFKYSRGRHKVHQVNMRSSTASKTNHGNSPISVGAAGGLKQSSKDQQAVTAMYSGLTSQINCADSIANGPLNSGIQSPRFENEPPLGSRMLNNMEERSKSIAHRAAVEAGLSELFAACKTPNPLSPRERANQRAEKSANEEKLQERVEKTYNDVDQLMMLSDKVCHNEKYQKKTLGQIGSTLQALVSRRNLRTGGRSVAGGKECACFRN